jgi:uncharacterized membrane protein
MGVLMTFQKETKPESSSHAIALVRLAAVLTTGVLAGAFAYGRFIVFPTFFDVPAEIQLRFRVPLMARNAPLMPPLIGAVLLSCAVLAVVVRGRERLVAGLASSSALACLLITFFGNVPLNKRIKTWNPEAVPPDGANLLDQWNVYNDLRSAAAIAPFLLISAVLLPALMRPMATRKQ